MKKYFKLAFLVLMIAISSFSLASCDGNKSDKLKMIKEDGYEYYEELKANIEKVESQGQLMKEIEKFLHEKNFDTSKIKGNNLVIEDSSKESKTALLVVCDIDYKKKTAQGIATLLATYKNKKEDQGLKAIIGTKAYGGHKGIGEIDKKILEGKDIILLESSNKKALFTGSVGTEVISLEKNMPLRKTKGDLAYEISIDGFESIDSGDRENKHTNPISFIGDILIRAQSADINIEIAKFNSSSEINIFPSKATAVVVIEKSSQEKFEERLSDASEKFHEKSSRGKWDAKMTYKKVDKPTKVLSYDDTTSILSSIYTLEDGVFKTSGEDFDGDILGVFTLATVDVSGGKGRFNILARYADDSTRNEMIENYSLTSSILGYKMTSSARINIWKLLEENKKFWTASGIGKSLFNKSYDSTLDLEENHLSLFSDDIKLNHLINVEFDFNDFDEFVFNLIDYIK